MNEVFNEVFNRYCLYLKYLMEVACAEQGLNFDSMFKKLSSPVAIIAPQSDRQNIEAEKARKKEEEEKQRAKLQKEQEEKQRAKLQKEQASKAATNLSFDDGYYVGETKNGLMHGKGTRYWFDKDKNRKWSGDWVNGEANGHMIVMRDDFVVYEGNMEHGQLNGEGKYTDPDSGQVYIGHFVDSNRDGEGTLYTEDGKKIYEGEWKKGKRHGRGKYYLAGICRYDGQWKDGKKHGKGTEYDAKGHKSFSGQWENDHKVK